MASCKAELQSPDGKTKNEPALQPGLAPCVGKAMPEFMEPIKRCGGPMQYLLAYIADKGGEAEFAKRLAAFFEPLPAVSYNTKEDCEGSGVELIFRLGDIGYSDLCTTKGQPRLHTSLQLVDCIQAQGFDTQTDPLWIWTNEQTHTKSAFWMSFVKGHTRSCTVLAMAAIAMDHFATPDAMVDAGLGHLLGSLKIIRVRVYAAQDIQSVAFQNANLAYKGSMRQAHDIVNWLQKLAKLSAATGWTADDLVAKWNAQAPVGAKIVGQKLVSLKHLLQDIKDDARSLLIDHASKYGANSAFTDDAFNNKKILPGHKPLREHPRWSKWLTVSHDSFILMLENLIYKHELNQHRPQKVLKKMMETVSQQAALVVGISDSLVETYGGLPRAAIKGNFIDAFVANDPNLLVALDAAIEGKVANFNPIDLPNIAAMIKSWQASEGRAGDDAQVEPVAKRMKVVATELESHEFKLWELRCDHDIQAVQSWHDNVRSREAQTYFKRAQHALWRAQECVNAALSLMDRSHSNCRVLLSVADSANGDPEFLGMMKDAKDCLVRKYLLSDLQSIRVMLWLNWTSMSLFDAKMSKSQSQLMGAMLKADTNGSDILGLLVQPTFTYRTGMLHKQKDAATTAVANHGINVDKTCAFVFESPCDLRTERPIILSCNLCVFETDCKRNRLLQNLVGTPVVWLGKQPKGSELVKIEDGGALPQCHTDETFNRVGQAERHHQIGNLACHKIINAADASESCERSALLLVDLSTHVGDMLKAFVINVSKPGMYVGLCESDEALQFAKQELIQFVKAKLQSTPEYVITGFTIPPEEMPMSPNDAIQPPVLSTLVWRDNVLCVAAHDETKWKDHDEFGERFEQLEASVAAMVPLTRDVKEEIDPDDKVDTLNQDALSDLDFIDAGSIQTEIAHDIPLTSTMMTKQSKPLVLKVCTNHGLYIVNNDDKDVTIRNGCLLVGYGKGRWTENPTDETKAIGYTLVSSSDNVIWNSRVTKVFGIIHEKRMGPEADAVRVMYHEMVDKPDKSHGAFELRCTQKLFYNLLPVDVKQEGQVIAEQNVAASLLSHEHWVTRFTSLHWLTKWQKAKGLQPIRPQITWTHADTCVPAGKALQLSC